MPPTVGGLLLQITEANPYNSSSTIGHLIVFLDTYVSTVISVL